LQVIVLLESGSDQVLQDGVLEDLPPGKVGIGSCLSLLILARTMVGGGNLDDGLMVIRSDLAPGK
jgi:hypothetical protein